MLLQQKKFTVAEVMYMVGFSNHSYFSKCFQAEFGLPPKQIRGRIMPLLQGQTLIRIYLVRVCPFFILLCPISTFGENDVALKFAGERQDLNLIAEE